MLVFQQYQNVNISMLQGEDISPNNISNLQITIPFDITGYSFKCQIGFPTPVVLTSANSGIDIVDAANGILSLVLASAQTETVPAGLYPYDFWAMNALNPQLNTPLFRGNFIINQAETPVP